MEATNTKELTAEERVIIAKKKMMVAKTDKDRDEAERELRIARHDVVASYVPEKMVIPPMPVYLTIEERTKLEALHGEAYRKGYEAYIHRFSMEPHSGIKGKANKLAYQNGWLAAKEERALF